MKSHKAIREIFGLTVEEPTDEEKPPETPGPSSKQAKKKTSLSNNLNAPRKPENELPTDLSEEEELKQAAKLIKGNPWDSLSY